MSRDQQDLLALLGYFYLQNDRPKKAVALLAALNLVAPGNRATLTSLALARLRLGQPKAALASLDELAVRGEIDTGFHLLRLRALTALRREREADAARLAYLEARRRERIALRPGAAKDLT